MSEDLKRMQEEAARTAAIAKQQREQELAKQAAVLATQKAQQVAAQKATQEAAARAKAAEAARLEAQEQRRLETPPPVGVPVPVATGAERVATGVTRIKVPEITKKVTEIKVERVETWLPEARAAHDTLGTQISQLKDNPASYRIEDPNTGLMRPVIGSDIDRLTAQQTGLKQAITAGEQYLTDAASFIQEIEAGYFTVTYYENGVKKTKRFKSYQAAQNFSKEAAIREADRALGRVKERTFTGPTTEDQKYYDQVSAIDYLVSRGAADVKEGKIVLRSSLESLPDDLRDMAGKAGFELKPTPKAPSFQLFEWGQKAGPEDSAVRKLTEYYSTVLGAGETAIANTVGFVSGILTGSRPEIRSVTPETIGYVKNLSPRQKAYLATGAWGGAFLGSYVSAIPVGVATSELIRGVASIAKYVGATTPAQIASIGRTISKHPTLARGILYGSMVGINAVDIYKAYEAGNLKDPMGEAAMRAAYLGGSILGFQTGAKVDQKVRDWWATRGRELIPPTELWTEETIKTRALPTYKDTVKQKWPDEFKDMAKRLTADGYLGDVLPEEYRVWHGTGDPWDLRYGEVTAAQTGTSLNKFPGLFVSPEPSPLRLGAGAVAGERVNLGIPGLTGTPELITFDSIVGTMPSGMTRAKVWDWLVGQVGKSTVYIPPVSMITREMEAVLPVGTKMAKIGVDWYTNWAGHRVLINKYILIPEELYGLIDSATPAVLTQLAKGGVEVSTLGDIVSKSVATTADTYLAFGITPTSTMYSQYELSEPMITSLMEETGLSREEILALSSLSSPTISELSSTSLSDASEPITSVGDIEEITKITEPTPTEEPPSISEPTPPPTEPEYVPPPSESEYVPPSEPTPTPPHTPLVAIKGGDKSKWKPHMLSQFPEPYTVRFAYNSGAAETKHETARGFLEAYDKANRRRRIRTEPIIQVEVETGTKPKGDFTF